MKIEVQIHPTSMLLMLG